LIKEKRKTAEGDILKERRAVVSSKKARQTTGLWWPPPDTSNGELGRQPITKKLGAKKKLEEDKP